MSFRFFVGEPDEVIDRARAFKYVAALLASTSGANETATILMWLVDQAVQQWPRARDAQKDDEFAKHLYRNLRSALYYKLVELEE